MSNKRKVVLDTETTGFPVTDGHKIIEIGCVEIIGRDITNNYYHQYINPEREVDQGAFEVHGIGDEFLIDKPTFNKIADEFLDFINGAELIIHNAAFDVGFLNNELSLLGREETVEDYSPLITDTLKLARKKHAGARATLDALAKRYNINQFNRDLHGALLDSQILAHVYLALTGGQSGFDLGFSEGGSKSTTEGKKKNKYKIYEVPVSDSEEESDKNYFS